MLTHFYCGQTARCIEMPLGMEIGLSPGDFVFDGDPAPSPKRGRSQGAEPLPNFRSMSIAPKRLHRSRCHMVQRYRPWPRRHCVRWEPSSTRSPKRGQSPSPIFGPCLLWPTWAYLEGGRVSRAPPQSPNKFFFHNFLFFVLCK